MSLIRLHQSQFARVDFWLSDLPPKPPTQAHEHVSHRRQPLSLSFSRQCICQVVSFKCFSFILQELSQVKEEPAPLHLPWVRCGRVTELCQTPSTDWTAAPRQGLVKSLGAKVLLR